MSLHDDGVDGQATSPLNPPREVESPYLQALTELPRAKRGRGRRGSPPKHVQAVAPIAPPDGEPPTPPDGVPLTSILAAGTPWGSLPTSSQPGGDFNDFARYVEEEAQPRRMDQQLGVLARHIMLDALWKKEGWDPRERFAAALAVVKTLEGSKGELWVQAGPRKDYTTEEYRKEREATELRLKSLLAATRRGEGVTPAQVVEAAVRAIEEEEVEDAGPTRGGEGSDGVEGGSGGGRGEGDVY